MCPSRGRNSFTGLSTWWVTLDLVVTITGHVVDKHSIRCTLGASWSKGLNFKGGVRRAAKKERSDMV